MANKLQNSCVLATTLAIFLATAPAVAEPVRSITLASTTSTEHSGLFRAILPKFTRHTGIGVRVIAVGTGAALRLGRQGDVDVLLVHNRAAEERFVAEGFGAFRREVMYNDFVIVGPKADTARIGGGSDAAVAFRGIARARATFVSRGDDSGTHMAERRLWRAAGLDPEKGVRNWYLEVGAGMGTTLNIANAKRAYGLSDRATWLSFGNRGALAVLVEGDRRLKNVYGVIPVNSSRHPHVKDAESKRFVEWLLSRLGRTAIAGFTIRRKQVFYPIAAQSPHGADHLAN